MTNSENDLIQDIRERLARIETKLDRYTTTEERANEAFSIVRSCQGEIKEMKDNQKWLWRSMFGVILTAIGAFISGLLNK